MPHGSPLWQTTLIFAGGLFLLWQIWRGWRAGVIQSGMHLAAILVSASLGLLAAKLVAIPFGGVGSLPGLLAGVLVGGGLGIFLFFAIWILGAVLFKRTEHQGSGFFWFLWGAGGAIFGLLFGLAVLWGGVSLVRSLGTFAESRVESQPEHPARERVTGGLLTLKESLELGSAGRFLESVDALPPDFYELVLQIGKVTSDQKTMLRFLQYPGIQEMLENPRIVDLMNDPGVIRSSKERSLFPLLTSEAVAAAVADPLLAEQLGKIDLREALKFALESPSPSPAPSPKNRQ